MKTEAKKLATIYSSGMFGVQKTEGVIIDFGTKAYAQYDNAPFVHFIKKGKRKPEGFIKGFQPYILILDGINHPDVDSPFGDVVQGNGVTTNMTRYSSFDERYLTEFDAKIADYIKDKTILMDIRHTVNTNIINK